jgi:hypothetical protein
MSIQPNFQVASGTRFSSVGNAVAYGNKRWVAVGSGTNTIVTSTDGVNWSAATGTFFSSFGNAVAYGNGRWVAVGGSTNTIATSTDGVNWSAATGTLFSNGGQAVAYGNGRWVAVGVDNGGNTIVTSTDGQTWSAATGTLFSTYGNAVAYGNGLWVAVGGGTNNIVTSTDGQTWSAVTGTLFSTFGNAVAYARYRWVAVGSATLSNTILSAPDPLPCFLKGSKILTDKGYVPIEDIRKGHMVKTVLNGFVPVHAIGFRKIDHECLEERDKDQLYLCSPKNYPELFEDLVITGCHSILVDAFTSEEQRTETEKLVGAAFVTNGYYRLPACVDRRTEVYSAKGTYDIYHIALENDSYYKNYGVYANGLLVETTSKRYLLELSGMKLLE